MSSSGSREPRPPANVIELLYMVITSTPNMIRAGVFVLIVSGGPAVGVAVTTGSAGGGVIAGLAGVSSWIAVTRRAASRTRRRS